MTTRTLSVQHLIGSILSAERNKVTGHLKTIAKTLFVITAFCAVVPLAFAQDTTWDDKLTAVLDLTDVEAKLTGLQTLLRTSEDPKQKILLNYFMGLTHTETLHYGSAIEPLKTALILNDTHTPEHYKRRESISELLQQALLKAGRIQEGLEVAKDSVARRDAAMTDMWAKTDNGMAHRFTALQCPNAIGDFVRMETSNFATNGRDVGCSYKIYRPETNLITVYLTDYDNPALDGEAAHVSATRMMSNARSLANSEKIYTQRHLEFNDGTKLDVLGSVFLRSKGTEYTGTWTSVIDGWVLKTRVTWDVSIGAGFGDMATRQVLAAAQGKIREQLETCKSAQWPKNDASAAKSGLEFVMLEIMTTATSRPVSECILETSSRGNAYLSGHVSGSRLYTIAGEAIKADVFVESGRGVNGFSDFKLQSEYILKSKHSAKSDGKPRVEVMKAYTAKPKPVQVFQDYIDIRSGKTKGYGRVEFSESGDSNVVIYQDGNQENIE